MEPLAPGSLCSICVALSHDDDATFFLIQYSKCCSQQLVHLGNRVHDLDLALAQPGAFSTGTHEKSLASGCILHLPQNNAAYLSDTVLPVLGFIHYIRQLGPPLAFI